MSKLPEALKPPEKASVEALQKWASTLPPGTIDPNDTTHWPRVYPPDNYTSDQFRYWIENLPIGVTVERALPEYHRYVREEQEANAARRKLEQEELRTQLRDVAYRCFGPIGFIILESWRFLAGVLIGLIGGYFIWK